MPTGNDAGGGTSVVTKAATVTRTDAQIKALPSAAVQLVAAQGANKIIMPLWVAIRCDTSANGYTNINAGASLAVGANSTNTLLSQLIESVAGSGKVSQLLAAFTDELVVLVPIFLTPSATIEVTGAVDVSAFANAPLSLFVANGGSGNFTGGDAANTMGISVAYTVIDLSA
jgi:hypothetical protein